MKRYAPIFACYVSMCTHVACAASLEGIVRDGTGLPMADVRVGLQNGAGEMVKSAQTDAIGHFVFDNIPVAPYALIATAQGHILGSMPVNLINEQAAHKDLNLADAQTPSVVIAQTQQQMRNMLSPQTGTNAYKFDQQTIAGLPLGEDTSLDKILLQAPGVAEDSAASGNLHIRGEHANVQYRLNGVLLPDGISGFGDTIDAHVIDNATLLDGSLPAQYGFRTAGVVDIDTKTGFQNGGTSSMTGGSFGTVQPSFSYGGTRGNADYFMAISHVSTNLGIENPTGSSHALHDHSEQNRQFGYASYMLDPSERVELIAGNSISYYQIPNNPNQTVGSFNNVNLLNPNNLSSSFLNERQFESNQYLTGAWQARNDGGVTVQVAPLIRQSELHFRPDDAGDLVFNGIASDVLKTDLTLGLQNDNSWRINADHTLRMGMMVQNDHVQENDHSLAYQVDPSTGTPLVANGSNVLTNPIVSGRTKDGQLYGVYLQDEWKITPALTMNYGARFDDAEQFVSANQLSPRLGLVYKATDTTTLHAGYARYFTPPPIELVSNSDLHIFDNTTNAAAVLQDAPVKPERTHSFDAGVLQKAGDHWQFGLDGYYKLAHDLLDEGQFGQALILTPFNYEHGYIYGGELTATYTTQKLKAYGNVAVSRAMGENVVSAQFKFSDPSEYQYIQNHYVHLDHDQTFTGSGGVTYDVLEKTALGFNGRYGSGLRSGFANTNHLPAYVTFDLSAEQKLRLFPQDETALRLTVTNLMDSVYKLRDGTGIGVGAPQYGARRGVFASLIQAF